MNRIAACSLSLLLAASLHALPAQAATLGGGIAGGSCGPGIDLVKAGATTDLKATDFNPVLASANGTAAGPEGAERRDPPGAVVQQAQWIRRTDNAVAEPGIGVLLVAGLLGMWAVARRRNLSS
ncbi:MAG TPA: hypothetical protein VFP62_08345 [Burkholderiales bacterium]|nr:hypothetical protein [Burkholderiales bacterium]